MQTTIAGILSVISGSFPEICPPVESKIIAVMQKLVKAESGFLIYDDLCKEHGRSVIDSMIEHNILHLRPTNYCSFDLPSQPKHKAIVTAESACGRIAMEDVLKELGK